MDNTDFGSIFIFDDFEANKAIALADLEIDDPIQVEVVGLSLCAGHPQYFFSVPLDSAGWIAVLLQFLRKNREMPIQERYVIQKYDRDVAKLFFGEVEYYQHFLVLIEHMPHMRIHLKSIEG